MKSICFALSLICGFAAANEDWFNDLSTDELKEFGFDRDEFNEMFAAEN